MRKKIEVSPDEWREASVQQPSGADASALDGDGKQPTQHSASVDDLNSAWVADRTEEPKPDRVEPDDRDSQIEELKKQLLYANAEFQNFRRRKEEEQRDLARYANAEMIKNLLPIVDNFDRALLAAERTRNFDALISGISGTSKQFRQFLSKAGVVPIEAVGKDFDPNFHEASGHSDDSGYPPNTVAEEVQRGYVMHDRVLRPTLVRVAQG